MKKLAWIAVILSIVGAVFLGLGIAADGLEAANSIDGIQIGNSSSTKMVHQDKIIDKDFHTIKVNAGDMDVKVVASKDAQAHISYGVLKEKGKLPFTWKVQDQELIVQEKKDNKVGFFFATTTEENTITISVPQQKEVKLDLEGEDGDYEINRLNLSNLDLLSSSGDITVKDCSIQSSQIQSEDGDIEIKDSFLNQSKIHSEDGDMALTGISLQTKLDVESENGNIDCRVKDIEKMNIHASSENGDISYQRKDYASNFNQKGNGAWIKVKSEDGDICLK